MPTGVKGSGPYAGKKKTGKRSYVRKGDNDTAVTVDVELGRKRAIWRVNAAKARERKIALKKGVSKAVEASKASFSTNGHGVAVLLDKSSTAAPEVRIMEILKSFDASTQNSVMGKVINMLAEEKQIRIKEASDEMHQAQKDLESYTALITGRNAVTVSD